MTVSLSSPITGATVSNLTSPTYAFAVDTPPDPSSGKQVAVTSLGGTQTGVRAHAVSDPFTVMVERPKQFAKLEGLLNAQSGVYGKVGENRFRWLTRKGVLIAAGNLPRLMTVETIVRIPAGAESYDIANVQAALSAHEGAIAQVSSGFSYTLYNGVL